MTWNYEQTTGKLSRNGNYLGTAYSGKDNGHNNTDMETEVNKGPNPRGKRKKSRGQST